MSLDRSDFDAFFAELHEGNRPFAWQRRLLDTVLDGGWPGALVAPTGSGKTAAIDVHVFALAVAVSTGTPPPPRRLAMVVGRRVLVDDQYRHAQAIAERLEQPEGHPVLSMVAKLLRELAGGQDSSSPLLVARLRGGLTSARRWVDHPTTAAVLCATPDMFGSRLLFRGYGSSRLAWPREAGLLAVDTAVVVDEAHLARQLLRTVRRVRELVPVAERTWDGPSPLQVVETTATPADVSGVPLGVEEEDLADGAALRERLCRPKPITLVPVKNWTGGKSRTRIAEHLARRTVELLDAAEGGTVGCFVNTVAMAVAVATALRDTRLTGRALTVVMLCGQVRPIDVELLEDRYPGLFTLKGNPEVDVVVSTQSLEVGVDLDLAGMVTELASGSALAQRAGRVNRQGLRAAGPVAVIVPEETIGAETRSGPYYGVELVAARDWLDRRAADPSGLAPWALREDPPPVAGLRRTLLQRPELGQVWHWARTSDDLAADPELELWLADDIDPDFTVDLLVRHRLPEDVTEAVELIKLLRPRQHEIFTVPLRTARQALADALATLRASDPQTHLPAILVQGDEVGPLEWFTTDYGARPLIRPGVVVVVDAGTPLFFPAGPDHSGTPPVMAVGEDVPLGLANDVLEATAQLARGPATGEVVHRIEFTEESPLAESLTVVPDAEPLDERAVVSAWLDATAVTPMAQAAAELLRTSTRRVDVVVQRDAEDVPLRVVVIDGRRAVADEDVRQEWTPNPKPVRLAEHQQAVAGRVVEIARQVGLPAELETVLEVAALHHDDGKGDPRFQRRLGARGTDLLAKSRRNGTPQSVRRGRDDSGLLPRWRHEQRSVVDSWPALPTDADRDLIARLIGTTHGHGRSSFPHASAELLGPDDDAAAREIAAELFDEGGWDELIERTELRYGVWGCAYLEALLRAADGQISGEGR